VTYQVSGRLLSKKGFLYGAESSFVENPEVLLCVHRHVGHADRPAHERGPRLLREGLEMREIPVRSMLSLLFSGSINIASGKDFLIDCFLKGSLSRNLCFRRSAEPSRHITQW
jgi:hypothetical protein